MDVARVRVCKDSDYVEIRLDWKYEGEDHHSLASIPLKHFRKEDMWSIVRMLIDAAEKQKGAGTGLIPNQIVVNNLFACDARSVSMKVFPKQEKEKKLTWISVSDRLPEDGIRVLIYADNGAMFAAIHNDGWYVDTGEYYYSSPLANITHWMPLPPAPKEDA